LIITRASHLRHFESKLLHAGTLLFDRNNHDGITDALTSNARCRVTIHCSPDYQKLSTVLPKTRRCCRTVASTKASRCLSRRVSYLSYTSALPVTLELSSSSLWKFATTTLADLPPPDCSDFFSEAHWQEAGSTTTSWRNTRSRMSS
jgi:hypothetical protein